MTTSLRLLLAAVLLSASAPVRSNIAVIEYYHAGFDHYFVTGIPDEIAKLDNGMFTGWARTGKQFNVYEPGTLDTAATCRFFSTSFGEKSSHFYTSYASECATVKANSNWQFEAEVFNVVLPEADGSCPFPTVPVYRAYNNGQGGAPNHRLVTTLGDRQAMLDKGYVAEGAGIGVGMCTPPDFARQTPEGFWSGVTSEGQPVRVIILPDRRYHIVYMDDARKELGVLAGSFTYAGDTLVSTDAVHVQLTAPLKGFVSSVNGTFSPGNVLQLNFGSSNVKASYDSAYDRAASLALLAGTYRGAAGANRQQGSNGSAVAAITPLGSLSIISGHCDLSGTVTARTSANVYDASLTGAGVCTGLALHAIVVLDSATGRISVLSDVFFNTNYSWYDVYAMFGSK
jgi:hypothetical protein